MVCNLDTLATLFVLSVPLSSPVLGESVTSECLDLDLDLDTVRFTPAGKEVDGSSKLGRDNTQHSAAIANTQVRSKVGSGRATLLLFDNIITGYRIEIDGKWFAFLACAVVDTQRGSLYRA